MLLRRGSFTQTEPGARAHTFYTQEVAAGNLKQISPLLPFEYTGKITNLETRENLEHVQVIK